jgi:ribose transport system permease protein
LNTQESEQHVTTAENGLPVRRNHPPTPDARSVLRRIAVNQRTVLLVLAVALFLGFGLLNPQFFNQQFVVFPLLRDASVFIVVGLAQMCALSIGQMNLAVGRMAAVGAMAAGACYQYLNLPAWAGVVVGLAVGALLGMLAGWLIVRTQVNAFVVTLALDFVLLGLVTLTYTALTTSAAFGVMPSELQLLRDGSFADICMFGYCGPRAIPILIIPALIVVLLIHHLYARSRTGREILATGANIRASELSGIPANRRVVLAHALSGTLAALAGIMLASTTGSFSAAIGAEFMIPSFLGPVLGGTLLIGGVVSIVGTVLGTLIVHKSLGLAAALFGQLLQALLMRFVALLRRSLLLLCAEKGVGYTFPEGELCAEDWTGVVLTNACAADVLVLP